MRTRKRRRRHSSDIDDDKTLKSFNQYGILGYNNKMNVISGEPFFETNDSIVSINLISEPKQGIIEHSNDITQQDRDFNVATRNQQLNNCNHREIKHKTKLVNFFKTNDVNTKRRKISHSHHLPETFVTILHYCTSIFILSIVTINYLLVFQLMMKNQFVECQRIFDTNYHQQQQPAFPLPINRQTNFVPHLTTTPPTTKSHLPDIITNQGGLIKDKNITLSKQFNPIVITKDIVIKKDAKLIIESGTEILFEKKKGIIVHGSLEILGNINDKVKLNLLRSQQSATINFRSQNNNQLQQVRLVDGDYPNEGRVQIKFNDHWHSLCTNSKNLTAADIKVLCHQVGYQEGSWYKWFPRRNDTTYQLMSKSFHCSGKETSISQCLRWNRVRAGGGICDHHSDIGIRCSKTLIFGLGNVASYDHWRGIEFVNSETTLDYILEGQMKQKISKSRLSHVIINEAGLNEVGNATAAIRVYGQPPQLNDIEIKNSVYGILVEEADDAINLNNVRLVNNMGFPLFINTSWGKVSMNGLHVENNGGDGIRVVRHEKINVGSHDFCKFANLGASQSYPVVLSHEQQFLTTGRDCCQEFISHNQLTAHFSVLRSTPNNLLPESDTNRRVSVPTGVNLGKDAYLVIYDDYRDEFPFRLQIQNRTRAQSIVSKSGRLKICYEPASYRTVLFTIEIVADLDDEEFTGIAHDVTISNSLIKRNEGRGLWVNNPRSGVKLSNVTVMQHNYLSGIHIENGTGEVIIVGSHISNNTGHGLYINLAGGYYHVDNSTISDNTLKGIFIDYDKRPELIPFNHTMHLGYSLVSGNGENGLFIGNVCRSDASWNISMTSFIKNGEDAIVFQSCTPTWDIVTKFNNLTSRLNLSDHDSSHHNNYQELYITHNVFLSNYRRAISMTPVYFIKSFIRHNLFKDHPLAVIYINNQALQERIYEASSQAQVHIRIASNRFYSNRGRYVANLGLQEDSSRQSLIFTKNYLEDNIISEPYVDLRPRSRVSAVVVVSSTNAKIVRNRFDNPQSTYELGAHLEAHSKIINATTNFWGHNLDASSIYRRIFDRKNRYNLAQVEFLQYLMSPDDLEYITDLSFDRERDKITIFRNGTRLGGEVKGFEELSPDTYIVQDDIFVRPGGYLKLKPGTILKFNDGVGMMVQGRFDALGQAASHILLTSSISTNRMPLKSTPTSSTPAPLANAWVSNQLEGGGLEDEYGLKPSRFNASTAINHYSRLINKRQAPTASSSNVRLSHTTMGRLEVYIDGIWGPVCDYNFDINDAAVVCQQLGMILNKDDWLLERYQYALNDHQQSSVVSTDALMTNLRCDPALDTDVTNCKSEISLRGDFDGMCSSEVGIRCFPPSWSGVRLGMGAEVSTLEYVTIQKAGMFDYASYILKPALQIDFYRHLISSIVVKSNSDSGIGIMWNDVIGRHFSDLAIVDSKSMNNEQHGIELRSRGLTISGCTMSNNRQNGLDYNPTFSQKELDDLISWLHTPKNIDNIVKLTFPLKTNFFSVPSSEDSYRFFIIPKHQQPDLKQSFSIGTDSGHMLSIDILNPIHTESTESLNMSLGLNPESPIWDLRLNITSFPMISPGYKFHFNYTSGFRPIGDIVLYIRSRYNNRDLKVLTKFIPAHLVMPKFDQTAANINSKLINSLSLNNCTITRNGIGLKFKNPNYPYGLQATFQRRYANETTNITNCIIESNHFSAIFVSSDEFESGFHEYNKMMAMPAELRYTLRGNKMRRNKDGIRQFGYNIRYAHNVFHWTINDTLFEQNRGGGINIVLPYFWRYDTNLSHSLDISHNNFSKNLNFEIGIDGHFVKLNFTDNIIQDNKCRNKMVGVIGMEKQMLFRHNYIENNTCNRLIDFNIHSHADKMGFVAANFEYNSIRYNRKSISNITYLNMANHLKHSNLLHKLHPQATNYALCLKGLQAISMTRNLFVNPELRFELVVAITMDSDEKAINAADNYWGSSIVADINDRIFDFDDWNSYALAEVSPFLMQEKFTATSMISEAKSLVYSTNIKSLGGRLMKSMVLPQRKEPYIVDSDLTIMPNVKLIIEKGAILEFMPSVGILVLGDLIAVGTREKPIQFRPLLTAADVFPFRNYLYPMNTRPNITQATLADPMSYEHNYASKHMRIAFPIDMGAVRLCKNEICNDGSHIYENNVEDPTLRREVLSDNNNTWKLDGFLEIFNMTTLQWAPVCDPLFTEHTARVVCRQLGYTHLSLFRRGRRYTIEQEQITSIRNWPSSLQCDGDESNLSSCSLASTGYMNHSTACHRDGNQFIYVYCRDFPENSMNLEHVNHGTSSELLHHWGGIRFSCPTGLSITNGPFKDNLETNSSTNTKLTSRSRIQYATVDRAGMLHRNKAPAIQVLQCNVPIEYVSITNSGHHGLEIIASQGNQNFHQVRLRNNLGVGVNYFSLTGSSSATRLIPYLPLKKLDISSDIHGLIDVCGASKEIHIEDRALLFFRYASKPVDCVKIISSSLNVKHIGIKMLQFDIMNSTSYMQVPDYVMIYDGNIFDRDSRLIAELGVTERHRVERPELKFYQTTDSTMTIRLHTSGSSPLFGFIAEVVTTPISYNIQRDTYNNMTFLEMSNNKLGALMISTAGESTPNIIIKNNRYESNCLHLFGNFTSCISPIYMELQNCQRLKIMNNLIRNNQGGITVKSYSHSAVSALDAQIENNVLESNHNTNTLALLGPKTDPYQTVKVLRNFITRNVAPYLSNIILSRIVANFSGNIVAGNIGKHQIEVLGFDKLPLSYQTFTNNWIYNNTATFERDRSTIFGNSAGQQYSMNYLVNPDNHFEMSTMNWSRYDVKAFHVPRDDEIIHLASGDGSSKDVFRKTADAIPLNIVDMKKLDLFHAKINAKQNWWGFNTTSAIQGRIRDRIQHEELIKVDFGSYLEANQSVLSGICAGGWQRVGQACLVFIGTRMTYQEAREFCDRERGTLPLLRGNHYEFTDFVSMQDPDFDSKVERIWVRSFDVSRDACPAINDFRTKNYDCQDRNPFLCEKDPQVFVSLLQWHLETGGLVALILATITFILTLCCSVCWGYKARHKHREKIERKNSLYASIRSNRGGIGYSSSNSVSELFLHRQIYNGEKSSNTDLSLSTQFTQPSQDESNLIRLDPTGGRASASIKRNYPINQSNSQIGNSSHFDMQRTKTFPEPQSGINPAYVSPVPSVYHHYRDQNPTPVPSYKEIQPTILRGSRSPSYNGSINSKILTDPMPNHEQQKQITSSLNYSNIDPKLTTNRSQLETLPSRSFNLPPPPSLPTYDVPNQSQQPNSSYQYSNINLSKNFVTRLNNDLNDQVDNNGRTLNQILQTQPQRRQQHYDVDGSGSSVPTYYSNQLETFEESTDSYLEPYNIYNETYNNVLQQRMNQDHNSYNITDRSSITDLVMNSSPYTQAIDEDGNLVGLNQRFVQDPISHQNVTAKTGEKFTYSTQSYKASSEVSSQSNRYCVETSFDTDPPTLAATSMFEGSQRLSPVSSSFGPIDSKSGSRVYLETSFE